MECNTIEEINSFIGNEEKNTEKLVDNLATLAIISKGSVSYESLKKMTYREIKAIEKAVEKYYAAKARAIEDSSKGRRK
jgi:hypothetical protein